MSVTLQFLGPDPLEQQITETLRRLAGGQPPAQIETAQVDVKEEPGRRRGRYAAPGAPTNEEAAAHLAGEMACMANTAGGGAIVLGIADDGDRIGSSLDAQWLRHRIYELTERKLTVDVREADLDGCRILVLATHEAIEPVRYRGRITWRVGNNCVEVDASTWHSGRLHRSGFDWSGLPSGHTLEDVRPVAVELASRYLRLRGGPSDLDLAEAAPPDLIGGCTSLTARPAHALRGGIDYYAATSPAGTAATGSAARVRSLSRSMRQRAGEAANVPRGPRVRSRPDPGDPAESAAGGDRQRGSPSVAAAQTVEHAGETLVTSPAGGINPSNIISIPPCRDTAASQRRLPRSASRAPGHRRREDDPRPMGRPRPQIYEIAGPHVRVTLLGGEPDPAMVRLVSDIMPQGLAEAVDTLLLIDELCRRGWVDADAGAAVLQRPAAEVADVIARLGQRGSATSRTLTADGPRS